MIFKLKEKCLKSPQKEIFYGAILNRAITDAYLGLSYLEPGETREEGPGKNHEEIIYLIEGKVNIKQKDDDFILNEGEAYFLPDGTKIMVTNMIDKRIFLITAGGHTRGHNHHHHHG